MSRITKYALSDLYEMSSGISSTKEQAGHGAQFVSFSIVFNNYFLPDELPDLMDTNEKEQEIYSIKAGDVLITRTSETIDELAMSCVAVKDYPKATYSGFTKRLRPKKEGIAYPKYMAFYFRSELFRKAVTNNAFMTLRASFNEDIFTFLDVYLPDYEEQVRIGDMLYAVECKIQKNKEINDYLHHMAYAEYMHMFYGKMPNTKLGDVIIEHPKSSVQVGEAKKQFGNIPFFTSGEAIYRWTESFVSDRSIFLNTGGNADVKFYVGNAAYSTDTWCISGKNNLSDYVYLILKSIKLELDQKFFQGTGLKHLQKPLLKDRLIYVPTDNELDTFNADIQPRLSMISDNIRESEKLTALRDWLLPMLINGQSTIEE